MKKIIALAFVLLLSACGSKPELDGDYKSTNGGVAISFHNGKVSTTNLAGGKTEVPYALNGNSIKYVAPYGPDNTVTVVFTLNSDGSLSGSGSMVGLGKFIKQ